MHILTNKTSVLTRSEFKSPNSINKKDEMLLQFSDLSSIRNPLRAEYLEELEKLNSKFLNKIQKLPENNLVLIEN